MVNNPIRYKGLSKDEIYLISRAEFEKQKIITGNFVQEIFNDYKKAANLLNKLTLKGRLIQIEKGKYFIVPIKAPNQLWTPNEFIMAKYWMGEIDYYIGYFTIYNYWGFTDQIPQIIYILNLKRSKIKVIGSINFKAVKIIKDKYYGIKKIKIDGENINISDKERTLVDFMFKPLGSYMNMKKVLKENIQKIDLEKFVNYLIKFPSKAVIKRTGYLLERMNCPLRFIRKIKNSIGDQNTFIVLNYEDQTRKGTLNKDWKLIINV